MLTAQLSTAEKVKINNSSPVPLIKNNTVPTSILTRERPVSNLFILYLCHHDQTIQRATPQNINPYRSVFAFRSGF